MQKRLRSLTEVVARIRKIRHNNRCLLFWDSRLLFECRPTITFVWGRRGARQIEGSADSRSPFPCRLRVTLRDLRGSDRDALILPAAKTSTKEAKQMGPCFVRGREPAGYANRDAEKIHERD